LGVVSKSGLSVFVGLIAVDVFDWPLGRRRRLVIAVGAGILGAAAFNLWRGLTGRFAKNPRLLKIGDREETIGPGAPSRSCSGRTRRRRRSPSPPRG